jgi:hypothetical protein
MTTVDEIELHDSNVIAELCGRDELVLHLRPAYVHHWECTSGSWRGVGRSQDATIRIAAGVVTPGLPPDRRTISDGWFRVASETYDNMIPVPIAKIGTVAAHLILVNAEPVDITGAALSVELTGAPRDIEDLPSAWAPKDEGRT